MPLSDIKAVVEQKLREVHDGLYQKALENRKKRTYDCKTTDELIAAM